MIITKLPKPNYYDCTIPTIIFSPQFFSNEFNLLTVRCLSCQNIFIKLTTTIEQDKI